MRRTVLLIAAAAALGAQPFQNNTETQLRCDDRSRHNDDQVKHCEIREFPGTAAAKLIVDGHRNGGAKIRGWSRSDMLIRAKVETWAASEAEAKANASQVHLQTAGGTVRADAPEFGNKSGWAVSYEIFVPHRTSLDVRTHNGGIGIEDIAGEIRFQAMNGGVTLQRLAGDVSGSTKNGGVKVELAGNRWEGSQMDVSTTNGGVQLHVPDNYSARLESSTVNGGLSVDYPVTMQGRLRPGRELTANLGSGGPLIRVKTVNGGVRIQRKS